MYKMFIKRVLDITLSFTALILLSPVFIVTAVLIKTNSRGRVLFRQKRVGLRKKYFSILKFRTMRSDTPNDVPTHMLSDSGAYITKVGAVLRKTSLDELPQLINILKGDMSIVGPRPALWNQYDLLAERDKYGANDIKPGLTGLAQINGRDELPIPVKAAYDGEYARSVTFRSDTKCVFLTVVRVFKRTGVVEGGSNKSANDVKL
jgi:O-antigen biosynthesis protein WbqP